mgnify:CR=1 FL=1
MQFNAYRRMWILVLFDLPVDSKKARRDYTRFRKFLLQDGFGQMQYSVYHRHCSSKENADVHISRIQKKLPPYGEVRIITLTEKQYERMQIFWGKKPKPAEKPAAQLEFF